MGSIVELCSAADAVEAHAIVSALDAAGIKAQVVGEMLQAAAGGLPLGEAIAPRVWVPEEAEQRAREVLAEYRATANRDAQGLPTQQTDADDSEWAETGEREEKPAAESEPWHDVSLLSVILTLAGLGCIALGVYYGFANHRLLMRYSGSTTAAPVGAQTPENRSAREVPGSGGIAKYLYTVDGVSHTFVVESGGVPTRPFPIRFDPGNPADYRLGEVLAPVWCLLFGAALGSLLLFLAYQFR